MHLLELARVASVGLLLVGVRRVLLRHDPLRGALEQREVRDPSTSADVICTAVEPVPMTPTRAPSISAAWSQRALWNRRRRTVAALDVRIARVVQHAGRRDHDVDFVVGAEFGLEVPTPVDEAAADDTLAVAHVRSRPCSRATRAKYARISSPGRTGGSIRGSARTSSCRGARDVAREPRIRVLAPGAAGPVALLVDGEVGDPRFQQLHAAEDAGHARADDRDAEIARCSSRFPCAHRRERNGRGRHGARPVVPRRIPALRTGATRRFPRTPDGASAGR